MKWQKILSILCVSALLASSLAACGSHTADSTAEPEPASTQDAGDTTPTDNGEGSEGTANASGKITIWEHAYGFEESTKELISGFNEKYPDIEVEYEIKDGTEYYSLLSTAIQSGHGPDLFWTNGTATANMADYVANGICLDLTDVVDFSLFEDAAMRIVTIDDRAYSIPWLTMDTRAVYYNKDMFADNGWEIPTTFSEFEQLLEDIKQAGIVPITLTGLNNYSLLFAYEPILSAMDDEYTRGLDDYTSRVGDQPAADALNKMLEWADNGYFGANWLGVSDNNAQILAFTSGAAAMDIAGSWDAATISENNPDLNFGAFQIPSEDGITGLVGTPANGFSVNAASKNLDAALVFANYCASLEAQTIWVQSQGAVSASEKIEPSAEIAREISASGAGNIYTSWQSVIANYSTTGEAVTIWDEDFERVFSRDISVEDFLASIEEVMQ